MLSVQFACTIAAPHLGAPRGRDCGPVTKFPSGPRLGQPLLPSSTWSSFLGSLLWPHPPQMEGHEGRLLRTRDCLAEHTGREVTAPRPLGHTVSKATWGYTGGSHRPDLVSLVPSPPWAPSMALPFNPCNQYWGVHTGPSWPRRGELALIKALSRPCRGLPLRVTSCPNPGAQPGLTRTPRDGLTLRLWGYFKAPALPSCWPGSWDTSSLLLPGRPPSAQGGEGTAQVLALTLTAYSWLVMRLTQVCTRAWAPSPSTSSCSW